jgi:hypothetical protein
MRKKKTIPLIETKDALETKIEIARAKMQTLWNERQCTDDVVLEASIELDVLLNQYQQVMPFHRGTL